MTSIPAELRFKLAFPLSESKNCPFYDREFKQTQFVDVFKKRIIEIGKRGVEVGNVVGTCCLHWSCQGSSAGGGSNENGHLEDPLHRMCPSIPKQDVSGRPADNSLTTPVLKKKKKKKKISIL